MNLDLDHPIHEQIDTYRDAAASNVPDDVREYYDGEQPIVVSPEQQYALGDRANRPLIENMIQRCVDTISGRLLFDRFVCVDNPDVEEALLDFATKNHFDRRVIKNTVRTLVDGNTANSLSWDAAGQRVVVHQEQWWDGEEGMFVETSNDGNELWAVKEWTDIEKRKRRTVYLPDSIQRFVRDGEAWVPFPDEAEHIQPWLKRNGEPLGVPVIHFANAGASASVYGDSKVEPLLGLQDALNGTLFDLVAALAMTAFGIYTATGVDTTKTALHVGPGRLWAVENKDAEFGLLTGASIASLRDGYQTIRSSIASQFPVAEHVIAGDWPSGTALVKAESQMVGYAKTLGDTWAPSYVREGHRATEIMNAFGEYTLDEDALIQIAYKAPEQLDEGTIAQINREKVETYRELAGLPKSLMAKTGIVDEAEAETIEAERASGMTLLADAGVF